MDRHNTVLRIMAESFKQPLEVFLDGQKKLGFLDANNRPTVSGIDFQIFQADYTKPQLLNNYNYDFETYVYFCKEKSVIAHIKVSDRSNYVDAESFAILTGYRSENELMSDNNIVLDIMNMVLRDTGQSLTVRHNIDGIEKEYFKIDLYLMWAKDYQKKQ